MSEQNTNTTAQVLTDQQKAISLFSYIRELNQLKQKAILNISEYPWTKTLSSFPNDPENISVFYRDRVDNEDATSGSTTLLSVHKPEFEKCPKPDDSFVDWLEPNWSSFRAKGFHIDQRPVETEEKTSILETLFEPMVGHEEAGDNGEKKEELEEIVYEYFADDPQRVADYDSWIIKRNIWADRQWVILQTRNLFADLYRLYFELQRDSETMELVVANGILCDKQNMAIKHPVLTKRVSLSYDAINNTVFVEETDSSPELYSVAFQVMEDINLSTINELQKDLQTNDYHPLDRNDTPSFLKTLVHQLSSESLFSESGKPENWYTKGRLLLYIDPCYIMRKRLDGTLKAIEQIIENVQETEYVPDPIRDIISGGTIELPQDTDEETVEEQLAAVGGENADILLSKEANKEQLEIAKRIENYNAVLVQGPPGTGKTHTIANLLGHFLAQGKSVLVTSQTPKALTVLKEKVASGLQDLCVSVLEDTNKDMERSIDGITDYMSRTTSSELKRDMDRISQERRQIINDLADTRRKIFQIINQENNCIVYNGNEISPSKAAAFVLEHAEDFSYIPGKVQLYAPLPLSFSELSDLYHSNGTLTAEDETELEKDIPNPEDIMSESQFKAIWESLQTEKQTLASLADTSSWAHTYDPSNRSVSFCKENRSFVLYLNRETLEQLKSYVQSFGRFEPWMKSAAVDGRNGGSFRDRWMILIDQIEKTYRFAEDLLGEQFGQSISFANSAGHEALVAPLQKLKDIFAQKGKLSKLTLMLNKDCISALEAVQINGNSIQSEKDCDLALHTIELETLRKQCSVYWGELLSVHGVPAFLTLDAQNPERIAKNWIPMIQSYLSWYQDTYALLIEFLNAVGIPEHVLFDVDPLDSEITETEKKLSAVCNEVPVICDICLALLSIEEKETAISSSITTLRQEGRENSSTCKQAVSAMEAGNTEAYAVAYYTIGEMYSKYTLQQQRKDLLLKLEPIAPQWAAAIKNRIGIHGLSVVPENIDDAWRWKQFSGIIDELTEQPFSVLQSKSIRLSKEYRKITAQYAEKSAWYHLLRKTEGNISMRQALQGWKQTVKKIGKGTGKAAPALKAEARKLMSKCQDAVPAWIMPINRALESLDPKLNRFDIVIIDEASQSDISSLAILYMGRKLIIVGDDKQVSPMAVGVEIDKMSALQQMYIRDKLPNAHLYDGKTSIYDVAGTTFQPLMLREHFRCVPEIIGFSNMLSYDYKIKPLRDAGSSNLLPAVVNYRVSNGKRLSNKTNPEEAEAIVALMQACMEQPEYAGKTFGAISLLGDEQVKVLQSLIEEKIDHKELIERKILCGNASHFQGDERDVIFLSVVDSVTRDNPRPIRLQGFGVDDAYRKRYNVAASRARDQLWVVDSLDSATDLKPGDIRKILIDYSLNPNATELLHAEIAEKADSPFEVGVAQTLVDRGYRLVQQWKVGAYRLDMVAVCGKKTVAIECDGERYHSGEAKVREDMERQTILERLGWRFIRIRGSEYYRDPEKTMERVIKELSDYEIFPDTEEQVEDRDDGNWDLLTRVKTRAGQIMAGVQDKEDIVDIDTIAAALDTKSLSTENTKETETPMPHENQINQTSENEQPSDQEENAPPIAPPIAPSLDRPKEEYEQLTLKTEAPIQLSVVGSNYSQKEDREPQISTPNHIAEAAPSEQKKSANAKPTSGNRFIEELKERNIEFVDNRQQSNIIWVIHKPEEKATIEALTEKHLCRASFERRGSIASNGRPAWRVIF